MKLFARLKQALRRQRLAKRQPVDIFSDYARRNKWGDKDSPSGKGSNLQSTETLRGLLPKLFRELGAGGLCQSAHDFPTAIGDKGTACQRLRQFNCLTLGSQISKVVKGTAHPIPQFFDITVVPKDNHVTSP